MVGGQSRQVGLEDRAEYLLTRDGQRDVARRSAKHALESCGSRSRSRVALWRQFVSVALDTLRPGRALPSRLQEVTGDPYNSTARTRTHLNNVAFHPEI